MSVVIETPRLSLRELTLDDLDFVAEMWAHPEVMRFYPKLYSRQESKEGIEKQLARYEKDGHGFWLVEEMATGEPVGEVGLLMQKVDGESLPEVGYLIHRPYWRRGYAAEAAAAVRDWGFKVKKAERLISLIRPLNLPSQGVAKKNGMKPWKMMIMAGMDHVVFSMTKGEWDV